MYDHEMGYGFGFGMGFGGIWMFLVFAILIVVPFFKLWQRTGHSGWLALLMVIPVVNIVMLYVLAFKQWPAVDKSGPSV